MSSALKLQPLEGHYLNEKSKPSIYTLNNNNFTIPNNTYVISKDTNGKTISKYSDNTWDLISYVSNANQNSCINFNILANKKYIEESKKLMFLLMIFGEGRNGSSYSVQTLRIYFLQSIKPLVEYAFTLNVSLFKLLSSNKLLVKYAQEFCTKTLSKNVGLSSLINFLANIGNNITGIDIEKDSELSMFLTKHAELLRRKLKQTPVIPSRIFYEATKARWDHIAEFEKNAKNLIKFYEKILESKDFALFSSKTINWNDALIKYGLTELFKKHNIINREKVSLTLAKLQFTVKHLIHTYSGMRASEAENLNIDCLISIGNGNYRIKGKTSKLEGRAIETEWVTTKEIKRAIDLLLKLYKPIINHYNIKKVPLFISPSLLGKKKGKRKDFPILRKQWNSNYDYILPLEAITIREDDIKELRELDPIRDWTENKYQIGEIWNFQSHQYRRSLAVYAIQSGLVSLGGLQIQMKHLFREMTMYYANGASYAKKLFNIPKEHIGRDFDKLKPELETLAYIKEVLFSEERLYGAHGKFIENNKTRNSHLDFNAYFLENRDKTTEQFKNGEIAYKETAIGGCVSTGACDYALTRSIVACGGCDSSIIKKSKLDNVINKQKEFIEFLDKDSIEYRTEMRDLEELEKQRKQFLGSKA